MSEINKPMQISQYRHIAPVLETTITVMPGTARLMHTIIKVEGHRDDDFQQGEYHIKSIIEAHDELGHAVTRSQELNQADGFEADNSSGGEETIVRSYRYYQVGSATLHLCLVNDSDSK